MGSHLNGLRDWARRANIDVGTRRKGEVRKDVWNGQQSRRLGDTNTQNGGGWVVVGWSYTKLYICDKNKVVPFDSLPHYQHQAAPSFEKYALSYTHVAPLDHRQMELRREVH